MLGGTSALLGGVSAIGGATSAQNEALNNSTLDHETEDEKEHSELKKLLDAEKARLGETPVTQNEDGTVVAFGTAMLGAAGNPGTKGTANTALKLGETQTINDVSMTRVGRWMSPEELAQMQSSNRIVPGGGGQTFTLDLPPYFRTQHHTKVDDSVLRRNSRGERYFNALCGCFSL